MLAFFDNISFIREKINDYCKKVGNVKILDVGCGDGKITQKILCDLKKETYQVYGLDIIRPTKYKFKKFCTLDLEQGKFPFSNEEFAVVYSNQVLEHLLDKDNFVSECFRILKKGGLFILSTENISSFDNIISLILCQEPLSQNSSIKFQINSFLSPHFMTISLGGLPNVHKNVCSYFSIQRLIKRNFYGDIGIKSFGNLNKIFETVFPFYNRLITVYAIKNN